MHEDLNNTDFKSGLNTWKLNISHLRAAINHSCTELDTFVDLTLHPSEKISISEDLFFYWMVQGRVGVWECVGMRLLFVTYPHKDKRCICKMF